MDGGMDGGRVKTVLILGGSTMQLPAIRIARRKGWRVVVADANPLAEGRPLADEFVHVDLKDLAGLEKAARDLRAGTGLDGVFTAGTDFSASVAWVAERLGLPGIPHEVALGATDKSRMREIFARHGVPHPDFVKLRSGDDPLSALGRLRFPLVVKPVDNMGSRGVRRVETPEELRSACLQAEGLSRSGTVIVEEYMEGPELSLDAIVYHGKVTICGVADRHIYFPPFFVELGHTMPSALGPELLRSVEDTFRAGIAALGIRMGAAKGDVKLTPSGPRIGEIAARLSGGYMSGWTYPYSSGVEVTEAGLEVAVGLDPGELRPSRSWYSAERAFISLPGIVARVEGLREAAAVPAVRNVFVRTPTGLRDASQGGEVPETGGLEVVFPTNNVEKCGNVITQAPSREEAVSRATEAIGRIVVRLRPDCPRTTEFLLRDSARLPDAPAYTLTEARSRAAYGALPPRQGQGEPLSYLSLDLSGEGRPNDWHGREIGPALREAERIANIGPARGGGGLHLGKGFWKAFLVGGTQGAVYYVDTVRERLRQGRDLGDLLGV